MSESNEVTFVRKPSRTSGGRLGFTVPTEIQQYIVSEQAYEVTLRPVGSLVNLPVGSPLDLDGTAPNTN